MTSRSMTNRVNCIPKRKQNVPYLGWKSFQNELSTVPPGFATAVEVQGASKESRWVGCCGCCGLGIACFSFRVTVFGSRQTSSGTSSTTSSATAAVATAATSTACSVALAQCGCSRRRRLERRRYRVGRTGLPGQCGGPPHGGLAPAPFAARRRRKEQLGRVGGTTAAVAAAICTTSAAAATIGAAAAVAAAVGVSDRVEVVE